jgi:hypothetical protein
METKDFLRESRERMELVKAIACSSSGVPANTIPDVHTGDVSINGINSRMFRRARKNGARIRELETHNEAMMRGQQQASLTKVKDVEDWIRIVQTRTRAFELLRKFAHNEEVAVFLKEIDTPVKRL